MGLSSPAVPAGPWGPLWQLHEVPPQHPSSRSSSSLALHDPAPEPLATRSLLWILHDSGNSQASGQPRNRKSSSLPARNPEPPQLRPAHTHPGIWVLDRVRAQARLLPSEALGHLWALGASGVWPSYKSVRLCSHEGQIAGRVREVLGSAPALGAAAAIIRVSLHPLPP